VAPRKLVIKKRADVCLCTFICIKLMLKSPLSLTVLLCTICPILMLIALQGKENIPPKELPLATDAVLSPGRAVIASGKVPARFDVAIDPSSQSASSASSSVHAAKRPAYNAMIPGPMFTGRPVAPASAAPTRAKTFLR
jgi:hypothetical protein